jgi:hypothetical protein
LVERILTAPRAAPDGDSTALACPGEVLRRRKREIDERVYRLYLPAPTCLRADTHRQRLRQAGGLTAGKIKLIEDGAK